MAGCRTRDNLLPTEERHRQAAAQRQYDPGLYPGHDGPPRTLLPPSLNASYHGGQPDSRGDRPKDHRKTDSSIIREWINSHFVIV